MSLVPAKCPECGGNVVVDNEKEAWVCDFCKTPFIVEKAVNNFNTINNVTNNINANVVNIVNSSGIIEEVKELRDRITMLKALKEDGYEKSINDALYEFYELSQNNSNVFEVHVEYANVLLDIFEEAITKKRRMTCFRNTSPLSILLKEYNKARYLNEAECIDLSKRIVEFYDSLFDLICIPSRSITELVDETTKLMKSDHYKDIVFESYKNSYTYSYLNPFADDFIFNKRYPKEYEHIFQSKIAPILEKSSQSHFEMVYGNIAMIRYNYYDEGYSNWGNKVILLKNSVTNEEEVNAIVKLNEGKVSLEQIEYWEKERYKLKHDLEWAKESPIKTCPKCSRGLSIVGKCKNERCKYYNKNVKSELKKEIAVLDEKIRNGKSS